MLALATLAVAALAPTSLVSGSPPGPAQPTAIAACQAFNLSTKVELMHGFGKIDGYSRNSGCGSECGRKTFRWDNGPQGFSSGNGEGPAGLLGVELVCCILVLERESNVAVNVIDQ